MTDKTYDILKFVALLIAPLVTFLTALVDIWNIPNGTQIVATLAAIDTLLGAVVVIAKQMWEKRQTK